MSSVRTPTLWLAVAALSLWGNGLGAQTPPSKGQPAPPAQAGSGQADPALRAEYDAAFQQTMAKPQDPAVLMKFAELAVRYGDVEGAISALERLLLIEGDQPDVKLELGVLYFRIGSKDAARAYLQAAKDSAQASPETKARAETFLKESGLL